MGLKWLQMGYQWLKMGYRMASQNGNALILKDLNGFVSQKQGGPLISALAGHAFLVHISFVLFSLLIFSRPP